MITVEQVWPPYPLQITCGDLSLRVVRDEDLPELIELALAGVHAPDRMPFSVPWTRQDPADLPREYVRFHWGSRAAFSRERFSLEFAVRVGGTLVGSQGLSASDFAVTRSAGTGSWLGLAHQGRGIGTRMRQAVCVFGFDTLGATELRSSAFVDNPASLGVSRKVGYRPDGTFVTARDGRAADEQRLLLRPGWLHRPAEPVVVTGAEPLLDYLGLRR
ncbi:RimJ/RimL family protein N-acetyltransferase [Friedmanniella endophytica]|uniref:RimJ/RimL family protein N-acetyltransferase n=1 Tax=Microlunatus kandeliicorticis TaxID=1759536 RepID=A0A7W3IUL7_9ACTN|nr:GNAT family protein [Microlunatus kandeliicorticis]MBA8795470.1 RimJ/RimL family protein N-acetyltransferase [Microlunatus kandeliicorticis]